MLACDSADDDGELKVLGCRLTCHLGTNCDECARAWFSAALRPQKP